MSKKRTLNRSLWTSACALAAYIALSQAQAQAQAQSQAQSPTQEAPADQIVVQGKRANRTSKGATGLPLEIKDTPQSISTIDQQEMADFGATSSNDALRLGTGINVDQYETNRASFNARGFDVQLTQIDGLGMTNDWGTVVGQLDAFVFDRIELIRGANGLLTGVGNASGTINYVRKRPKNEDGGLFTLTGGSYGRQRAALDYNKVLTQDGAWAGRLVVAQEDRNSYLRSLKDKRSTVYGVVDGQIGDNGVLTLGFTHQSSRQKSPMWGSLTLNYLAGGQADFDRSSSTSQDWTYWNTQSDSAFVEYTHSLGADWEAKVTYTHRRGEEDTRLFYAYAPSGGLNPDNTGLIGWPYDSFIQTTNDVVDANLSGQFEAFGRKHRLLVGISHSRRDTSTDVRDFDPVYMSLPLPAFPYGGDVYPEPAWGPLTPSSSGKQQLTRAYAATQLALTDRLKGIVGINAIRLSREGSSRYGGAVTATDYPDTEKLSPYVGATYDLTPDVLGYVSYSDIFQNQDQTDANGTYLPAMKGVNVEAGVKAEWLDKKFLTTFALFTAEQKGLATYAGVDSAGSYYYMPQDVKSKGVEFEATGRIGPDARLTAGLTRLQLTGPDGENIYEWIPRTTANLRFDTRVAALPPLRLGVGARWQSDVRKDGGARQDAYVVADAFASYQLTPAATVRLNLTNLFDKKYVGTVAFGGIYGAPREAALTLEYAL